jgi:hypothetical protein
LTLAAARHDLKRFLRAHVWNVDGGEWVVGDDIERRAGSGARECTLGKQGRQRTFQAAQVQHFRGRFAIIVHNDSS